MGIVHAAKMKHIIITFFLLFSLSALAEDSPQIITLNTPVMEQEGITVLVVKSIILNWENSSIEIHLGGPDGGKQMPPIYYIGTDAQTLLNQINTMNLTTNSLCKRILQKLINDGYLPAGTITTP